MPDIRRLVPGDEEMVDAFLVPHTASSMFLRSNLRRAGLAYEGEFLQGIYLGAFKGGVLTGVIAHYWNGNMLMQAPHDALDLAKAVLRESDLPLKGFVGVWNQVNSIREGLGIAVENIQMNTREILYALPLDQLIVPSSVAQGMVCRRSTAADLDQVLEWRVAYDLEALNKTDTLENRATNTKSLERRQNDGHLFVLEADGQLVAMNSFNATLDGYVQIGGVWTPPELRSQGYARAVVGGALQMAREEGFKTAILFTGDENPAAQRAYAALGFQPIGDYGLILFGEDARGFIRP